MESRYIPLYGKLSRGKKSARITSAYNNYYNYYNHRLEVAGVKALCVVADGASVNRKFFKMHKSKGESSVYKTENRYTREARPLYFVSDVPHLIKTTRNCFSHSFAHGRTRKLWVCQSYSTEILCCSVYDIE